MKENNIIEKLKKDSPESLLYIATMEPKIQADALELIYNKKNVNSDPIAKARNRLLDNKLIIYGEGYSQRPIKANIQPFLDYLFKKSKEQSKVRKSRKSKETVLNETDIEYLKLILDSSFYRSIFFNRFFFDNGTAIIQSTLKRDVEKLTIPAGAFGYMEAMLMSIVGLSKWLEKSGEFADDYIKDSDIDKIVKDYSDPDKFVRSFLESKNPGIFKHMMEYPPMELTMKYSGLNYAPQLCTDGDYSEGDGYEYYLDKTIFSGLFLLFPPQLINKLELADFLSTGCTFTGHFPAEVVDYLKFPDEVVDYLKYGR